MSEWMTKPKAKGTSRANKPRKSAAKSKERTKDEGKDRTVNGGFAPGGWVLVVL